MPDTSDATGDKLPGHVIQRLILVREFVEFILQSIDIIQRHHAGELPALGDQPLLLAGLCFRDTIEQVQKRPNHGNDEDQDKDRHAGQGGADEVRAASFSALTTLVSSPTSETP